MRKHLFLSMPYTSVVIPTYNEKKNIIPLLEQITKILSSTKTSFELLVVDDSSPDHTAEVVKQYAKSNAHVRLITRKKDFGLGKAIGEGIKHAKGDIIVGMDADFNHDPKTIPLLLKALQQADLVVASRFLKKGGMEETTRFIPTLLFNKLFMLVGFPVSDNTSGFYAVWKKVIDTLGIDAIYYGYGDYHLRLVYFAKKKKFVIREVPTYYKKRRFGQSKSHLMRMGGSYTKEAFRLAFS